MRLEEKPAVGGKRSEEVLDAAYTLFTKSSIEAVSMTDIADEAKIGVATIYRYFGTKQQLVICVIAREWAKRTAVVKQRFEDQGMAEKSGYDQLAFLVMNLVNDYESLQDLYHLSGNVDQYIMHEEMTEEMTMPYREAIHPLFDMLYAAFDLAIEQGDVSTAFSDRTHQRGGIASIVGAAQKYAVGGVFGGASLEEQKQWLRSQANTYLYCVRHFDEIQL